MPTLLDSIEAFENQIKNTELSVVHFSADFVEQCKQVDDVLDTLSKQTDFLNVKFCKCHAEDLADVSLRFKVEAVPTVILFKLGDQIDRVDGADIAKITAVIRKLSNNSNGDSKVSLEERLKALINRHQVMLFMKGSRDTPRCGFSRQMIELLNREKINYETFDILTDEEVRQGLKTYSDWPTYPQLYVKGELIGGLDIVSEMITNGELHI